MKLGIVGSEGAKFTEETEQKARELIRSQLMSGKWDVVISGACHLGGIDIWAVEEAKKIGLDFVEYPPKTLSWETGYKPRNIKIATFSDKVICITVKTLPSNYAGMVFAFCYHCKSTNHIKSGGCWTVKYAKSLGKPTEVLVVE